MLSHSLQPQATLQAVHSKLILSHSLQPQVTLQAVHSNLMLSHSLQPQATLQAVHSNLMLSHSVQPQANLWIPAFNLTQMDKGDLISGKDLNDKQIHAAQKLLKNNFPIWMVLLILSLFLPTTFPVHPPKSPYSCTISLDTG